MSNRDSHPLQFSRAADRHGRRPASIVAPPLTPGRTPRATTGLRGGPVSRVRACPGADTAARRAGALRIGLLGPPWFPVPPPRYGGVEAVVALLADGLVAAGHDVTLFASGESSTRARLVAVHAHAPSAQLGHTLPELQHVLACIRRAGQFDVISDHSGPLALALSWTIPTPFVHTVHNALDDMLAPAYDAALEIARNARLVSLSPEQRLPRPGLPWIATIPNAVDLVRYPCRSQAPGEYLLWIGRMCREKGPDRAIEVARQAGLPILLAGKMDTADEREYFERRVQPHLGRSARYVGEADRATVVALLHWALALVNPIDWPEPFGLVMIEAMACGVPVLATRCGGASEIVVPGVTGFLVDDYRSLADAIPAAAAIRPEACRAEVERRFSPGLMVHRYVNAFRAAIAQSAEARLPEAPPATLGLAQHRPPAVPA
jgi:glycosyltransferase involved in cell wall biosynthesis